MRGDRAMSKLILHTCASVAEQHNFVPAQSPGRYGRYGKGATLPLADQMFVCSAKSSAVLHT